MFENAMNIKDVKIPDIEEIVKLKPLAHTNGGTTPVPRPPLFNVIENEKGDKVYDDKWHHANVKYTAIKTSGPKSGARKKDKQKPKNLR